MCRFIIWLLILVLVVLISLSNLLLGEMDNFLGMVLRDGNPSNRSEPKLYQSAARQNIVRIFYFYLVWPVRSIRVDVI